jgi:hypothetical protein
LNAEFIASILSGRKTGARGIKPPVSQAIWRQ